MLEHYQDAKSRDYLLHVITARHELTYSQLKTVIKKLYETLPGNLSGERDELKVEFILSQALEALGHCNFDFQSDGPEVAVRPPSFDRLPVAGKPTAVLTGGRSPETFHTIASQIENTPGEIELELDPASGELHFIPLRIVVRAESENRIRNLAHNTGIDYCGHPPTLKIADRMGALEEYLGSLPEPKSGGLESWPGRRDYFPEAFRFRDQTNEKDEIRLSGYNHPYTGQSHYFLFHEDGRQEVDREWGRYAVLRETALRPLVYDRQKMLVAIPNGARLPSLQSRALSMCSGYAPRLFKVDEIDMCSRLRVPRPEQFGYHVYRWVDPRVLDRVAQSLAQNILEAKIEH